MLLGLRTLATPNSRARHPVFARSPRDAEERINHVFGSTILDQPGKKVSCLPGRGKRLYTTQPARFHFGLAEVLGGGSPTLKHQEPSNHKELTQTAQKLATSGSIFMPSSFLPNCARDICQVSLVCGVPKRAPARTHLRVWVAARGRLGAPPEHPNGRDQNEKEEQEEA